MNVIEVIAAFGWSWFVAKPQLQKLFAQEEAPEDNKLDALSGETWFIGDTFEEVCRVQGAPDRTVYIPASENYRETFVGVWGEVPRRLRNRDVDELNLLKNVDLVFFDNHRVETYCNNTGKLKIHPPLKKPLNRE